MMSAAAVGTDLDYLASRHRIAPFTLHRPLSAAEGAETLDRYGGCCPALAVRHWLAGNVCRCTGYESIVAAVLDAARRRRLIQERL